MTRKRIYPRDLTGITFTRLTVLGPAPKVPKKPELWICRCSCGKEGMAVMTVDLVRGHTKSCGCYHRDYLIEKRVPIETGQRFHHLVALEPAGSINKHRSWLTLCDCGTHRIARVTDLAAGRVKHCGCKWRFNQEMRREDLVGQRFGKLEVLEYIGVRSARSLWRCKCDCGNETEAMSHNLKYGRTGSCTRCPKEKAKPSASAAPGNTA